MTTQLNRVELLGTVGSTRIQEINGKKTLRFALVTNRTYRDKDGCAVVETSWHNCIACEKPGIANLDTIHKGTTVHLHGRIRYMNYTNGEGIQSHLQDIIVKDMKIVLFENGIPYETDETEEPGLVFITVKKTTSEFPRNNRTEILGLFTRESDAVEAVNEAFPEEEENYIENTTEPGTVHCDNHNNGYARLWNECDDHAVEFNIIKAGTDRILNIEL